MRVRVLYPTALPFEAEGGKIVDLDDEAARAYIVAGFVEAVSPKVERATKAPGEKRDVRRPKG